MNKYSYASSEKIIDMVKTETIVAIESITKSPAGWEVMAHEINGVTYLCERILDKLTAEDESNEQQ